MSDKQQTTRVKVGITLGDINGIGPEIIMKAFSDSRILDEVIPVIYGSAKVMSFYKKCLNLEFNFNSIKKAEEAKPKKLNLINCWQDEVKVEPGVRSKEGGKYALTSLEAAVKDLASNKVDVLVTAPIDKKQIQSDSFNFPGHTEYLASMSNVDEALMLMVCEGFRIGVVTGHIPLKDVPEALTKDKIVHKIEQIEMALKRDFKIVKPKIAVLGLNPHAGEKSMIGEEEEKVIIPAINQVKQSGSLVFGPYPSDGFFGSANYKDFDAVLAMYHDQGLIPFKALSFGRGVNYTAGLPIVRTSPDHGTAFEIAGKNLADEGSFRYALYVARDVFLNRKMHKEITADTLKPQKIGD